MDNTAPPIRHALVVGVGTVGRQVASRLEILGVDVCLLDVSPINLHPFAQLGFHTVAGNARHTDTLRRAKTEQIRVAIINLPDDDATRVVVRAIRKLNPAATIVARCHFRHSIEMILAAGATSVISEEVEASRSILQVCERLMAEPRRDEA